MRRNEQFRRSSERQIFPSSSSLTTRSSNSQLNQGRQVFHSSQFPLKSRYVAKYVLDVTHTRYRNYVLSVSLLYFCWKLNKFWISCNTTVRSFILYITHASYFAIYVSLIWTPPIDLGLTK
jgi:hypothetical protein